MATKEIKTLTTWARRVKKRDNYICQECKCNEKNQIIAHHINPKIKFPELKLDIRNGISLCKDCHKKNHKKKKIEKQVKIFDISNIEPIVKANTSLSNTKIERWNILDKFRRGKHYYYNCVCECGIVRPVREYDLEKRNSKSCGCLQKEIMRNKTGSKNPSYKHGKTKKLNKLEREYKIWSNIKTRCFNKNSPNYKNYGERGIIMCDEWKNNYINFIKDMGYAPSDKHEIERIDVNGNYMPQNCTWATRKEQLNNTRFNKFITYNGITKNYTQWEEKLKFKKGLISQRKIKGWSDEKCITTKVKGDRNG